MSTARRSFKPLLAATTAAALTVLGLTPATAIVRFEPSPAPIVERWAADVPVEVGWAGVTLRFPGSWKVKIKRAPAVKVNGAALLVAFGPGDSMCYLDRYDAGSVETWQDVGVSATAELEVGGYPAERFDDLAGGLAAHSSVYSIDAGSHVYALLCWADRAPEDRWLSIAESLSVER